jgi:predicted hydrocarbon binding protein
MRLPKDKRQHIEESEEIVGFLTQRNISEKNLARLMILAMSKDEKIAEMATVVQEVGKLYPHKKRRIKLLAREHKELFAKLCKIDGTMVYDDDQIE